MIKIKRCVKWYGEANKVPCPYCLETEDGLFFIFEKGGRWELTLGASWSEVLWIPCSPLEVIVCCGTKGLEGLE